MNEYESYLIKSALYGEIEKDAGLKEILAGLKGGVQKIVPAVPQSPEVLAMQRASQQRAEMRKATQRFAARPPQGPPPGSKGPKPGSQAYGRAAEMEYGKDASLRLMRFQRNLLQGCKL